MMGQKSIIKYYNANLIYLNLKNYIYIKHYK